MTDLAESQKKIQPVKFSDSALVVLRHYDWPGNYDQLAETVGKHHVGIGRQRSERAGRCRGFWVTKGKCNGDRNHRWLHFNMPFARIEGRSRGRYFEYHIAQEGQNMTAWRKRSVWSVHTFTANSNNSVSAYQPQRRQTEE